MRFSAKAKWFERFSLMGHKAQRSFVWKQRNLLRDSNWKPFKCLLNNKFCRNYSIYLSTNSYLMKFWYWRSCLTYRGGDPVKQLHIYPDTAQNSKMLYWVALTRDPCKVRDLQLKQPHLQRTIKPTRMQAQEATRDRSLRRQHAFRSPDTNLLTAPVSFRNCWCWGIGDVGRGSWMPSSGDWVSLRRRSWRFMGKSIEVP